MKWLVLLALVGLASCRTVLVGGNNARDVTIQYTYEDQRGEDVNVEYEADLLNLSLLNDASLTPLNPAAPVTAPKLRTAPSPSFKASPIYNIAPEPTPKANPAPLISTAPMVQMVSMPLTATVQMVPMTTFAIQPSVMQVAQAPSPILAPQPQYAAVREASIPAAAPRSAPIPAAPRRAPAPVAPQAPAPKPQTFIRYTDNDSSEDDILVSLTPRRASPAAPRSLPTPQAPISVASRRPIKVSQDSDEN